jgi:hypothetical protein
MKPRFFLFALFGCLWLSDGLAPASAQVPAEFSDLYPVLQADITNFETSLDAGWDGTFYTNCQFAAVLVPATDGGEGVAATNQFFFENSVLPFLNGLQSLGVKTIKVSINFPTLYQPYYDSVNGANNPAGYTNMFNFFTNVVYAVRQRGMGLIIPSQNLFPFEQPAVSNYYASLNFNQYTNGRSAQIQTITRYLKPDVIMLQSEPVTEVENLTINLSAQLNDPVTDTNMLVGFLNDLKNAGLRTTSTLVGAGMGTWQPSFNTYLTNFVSLPLDILDVHVYPINRTTNFGFVTDFLQRTIQMADAAHSRGMKVGMGECWVQKERNSELANPPSELVFEGRNTYSFWSPLDREFLLAMVKLGHYKKYEFIDPFWTSFFFAQLDYTNEQSYLTNASADANALSLSKHENSALSVALAVGSVTNTGLAYAEYILTNPPTLNLATTNYGVLNFVWTPVASKYLLESTKNLTTHSWTAQTISPRPVGEDYAASVKTTNGDAFFRLHLP